MEGETRAARSFLRFPPIISQQTRERKARDAVQRLLRPHHFHDLRRMIDGGLTESVSEHRCEAGFQPADPLSRGSLFRET